MYTHAYIYILVCMYMQFKLKRLIVVGVKFWRHASVDLHTHVYICTCAYLRLALIMKFIIFILYLTFLVAIDIFMFVEDFSLEIVSALINKNSSVYLLLNCKSNKQTNFQIKTILLSMDACTYIQYICMYV